MNLNEKVSYGAVAAAVALACGSITADAAGLSSTAITMSQQGNALATTSATVGFTVAVSLGANYIQNDTAQLTFSGGSVPTSGTPASATCSGSGATFGALSYDTATNKANYRVTTGSPLTDNVCTFVVSLRSSTMSTAGNVTASYAAQTASSGLAFDSGSAAVIGVVRDQFIGAGVSSAVLDGIVDVNTGRYHFTTDDGSALGGTEDQFSFSITNRSSDTNAAGVTSVVVSVNGDFSFLDDDGTAGCTSTDITGNNGRAAVVLGGGSLSVNSACTILTYTETAGVTTGARTIALGKNNATNATVAATDKVLTAPQSFSGSIAFTYANSSSGSESDSVSSFGAWTLNGASINVAFMPYAAEASRILNLTNRSSQAGAVNVTAINEAGTACASFSAGTIGANSILNISAAVDAGIRNCYGATFTGRVALTVTANIPGTSAELYSGYNRNGSLSTVVNSSNGRP